MLAFIGPNETVIFPKLGRRVKFAFLSRVNLKWVCFWSFNGQIGKPQQKWEKELNQWMNEFWTTGLCRVIDKYTDELQQLHSKFKVAFNAFVDQSEYTVQFTDDSHKQNHDYIQLPGWAAKQIMQNLLEAVQNQSTKNQTWTLCMPCKSK